MPEFYKYVKRDVGSQVDWATIAKNLNTTLQEEVKFREDKKAQIEKETNDLGQILANAPTGESTSVNDFTLSSAKQWQEARLLQDKMLKTGQLSVKDYTLMRQNIKNDSNNLFNLSREYQEEYKIKMDRAKEADPSKSSQDLETYLMSTTEGFANLNNVKLVVNPNTHESSLVKLLPPDKDGIRKASKNASDLVTVNELRNRLKSKYNNFNVTESVKTDTDKLGVITRELVNSKTGIITKIKTEGGFLSLNNPEIENKYKVELAGYLKSEEAFVSAALSNPYNVSAILTNWQNINPKTNKPYTYTFNKEEQGGDNILLLKDGNGGIKPDFTEEQMKVAQNYYKTKLRSQLDQELTVKTEETAEERAAKLRYTKALTDEAEARARAAGLPKKAKAKGISQKDYELFAKDVTSLITDDIAEMSEEEAYDKLQSALSPYGYTVSQEEPARPFQEWISIKRIDEEGNEIKSTIQLKTLDSKNQIINYLLQYPPKDYKYRMSGINTPVKNNQQGMSTADKMRAAANK